jgi:hypothetical protein
MCWATFWPNQSQGHLVPKVTIGKIAEEQQKRPEIDKRDKKRPEIDKRDKKRPEIDKRDKKRPEIDKRDKKCTEIENRALLTFLGREKLRRVAVRRHLRDHGRGIHLRRGK